MNTKKYPMGSRSMPLSPEEEQRDEIARAKIRRIAEKHANDYYMAHDAWGCRSVPAFKNEPKIATYIAKAIKAALTK